MFVCDARISHGLSIMCVGTGLGVMLGSLMDPFHSVCRYRFGCDAGDPRS